MVSSKTQLEGRWCCTDCGAKRQQKRVASRLRDWSIPWWWWSSESCESQGKEQGVLAACPSPVSPGVCGRQWWGVRVIKGLTVMPESRLIVKMTVVDVLLPRTLIGTSIRQDDLNFELYWETVYDSGHAPPWTLDFLYMLLVSECINCIREGDVKNRKIVIISPFND